MRHTIKRVTTVVVSISVPKDVVDYVNARVKARRAATASFVFEHAVRAQMREQERRGRKANGGRISKE